MRVYIFSSHHLKTLLDTLNSRVQLKRLAAGTVEETGDVRITSFKFSEQIN